MDKTTTLWTIFIKFYWKVAYNCLIYLSDKNCLKKGKRATPTWLTSVYFAKQKEPGEKMKYNELSNNTVTFVSCRRRLTKVLAYAARGEVRVWEADERATVLAESSSYFIFSLGYLHDYDVYRHESGRCHSLSFSYTVLICSYHIKMIFFIAIDLRMLAPFNDILVTKFNNIYND